MKTKSILQLLALVLCAFFVLVCVGGCQRVTPKAKLKGGTQAVGPADNGTPAKVDASGTVTTLTVPAGSTVETVSGAPATPSTPAVQPSVKVTLAAPSELRQETHQESAQTGTVDTTVAKHRIDTEQASEDRRPLLWVAIGCGVVGVLLRIVLKEWPAWGNGFLLASVLAGVAWKVAEVPWWAWLAVLLGVALVVLGYKRKEWDANGNGVPDALEGKK